MRSKPLNAPNLDAAKGEFVDVIGPSGCGTSTLLNLTPVLVFESLVALLNGIPRIVMIRLTPSGLCGSQPPESKRFLLMGV